jgi:hypothetical protein
LWVPGISEITSTRRETAQGHLTIYATSAGYIRY